jgi:phosphoglycerol transferase
MQPAAPSYQASFSEGIAFAKPGYPEFVARTEGISQAEPFGRWTDGPKVAIVFKDPLPKQFELVVTAAAYGPNIDQPVRITVGGVTQEIVFNSDLNKDPQARRLSFSLEQAADRIDFLIPQPTQPANGDVRKLGIALVELKIEPAAK